MIAQTVTEVLEQSLAKTGAKSLVVAYSGGLDSSVLLHAACAWAQTHSGDVRAVHINHHLQSAAGLFEQHCQTICQQWQIALDILHVEVQPKKKGIEAAAREQRYHALFSHCSATDVLLTAQHADDQVETFLLQLFRGAGVQGLASMPSSQKRHGVRLLRPFLPITRRELELYAQQHAIQFVDDPSNDDTSLERNWLRKTLLPQLIERRSGLAQVIQRSAQHMGEAAELLDELAQQDASGIVDHGCLILPSLFHLNPIRQKNLMRHWLKSQMVRALSADRLSELLQQIASGSESLCVTLDEQYELRIGNGRAIVIAQRTLMPIEPFLVTSVGRVPLPLVGSELCVSAPAHANDAGLCKWSDKLSVRSNPSTALSIKLNGHAHHKKLKNIFQEMNLPVWLRRVWPCLYISEELIAMPGLFYTERGQRWLAEYQLQIELEGAIRHVAEALQISGDIS